MKREPDRLPEEHEPDPVLERLKRSGLVVEVPALTEADYVELREAEAAYREAVGDRVLGLSEAFLEERRSGR